MYFLVNNVDDKLQLPTLISIVGEAAYELMVNLCSPKKPAEKTYKEVVELMSTHLQPTPSMLAERFKFRQYRQCEGQSIAQFVEQLKKLSRFCDFGTELDSNMRDQFVCGLCSDGIRQRLFVEKKLTFSTATAIALSLEAAERDALAVETTGVNFIKKPPVRRTTGCCVACGDFRHKVENCKFRDYVCSRCKNVGHLRRMCSLAEVNDGDRKTTFNGSFTSSRGGGRAGARSTYRGRGAARGGGRQFYMGQGTENKSSTAAAGRSDSRDTGNRQGDVTGMSTEYVQDDEADQESGDYEEPMFQMSLAKYRPI
ncbi:uncharacterized protein LOC114361890 [Ostrinia furnacalis]|uniref:uncharacterized protein LOC114361890 n=1 Tax=Ostrinia furnacalis TaxID=93504 RepID=UPI00103B77F5|nr:uncharacterized protein LOC114361890 [Ostrinia furnacalis]